MPTGSLESDPAEGIGFHLSPTTVIGSFRFVHRYLPSAILMLTYCLSASAAETNQLRQWNEYRTIMWIGDSAYKKPDKLPLFFQRLREMGINTAMVFGDADPQPLLDNHFPYYVENIVNKGLCLKFNSKVTDWDKFVTDWTRNERPASGLIRDYCLDDPAWNQAARQGMEKLVRKNMAHGPLAYDIRDELSTTISANPFDYDFNPLALQAFRDWLKSQYVDLPSLNAEWRSQFGSWEEVRPFTTDEIKNRMASGEAIPRGKPDWQSLQRLKFDPKKARDEPARWNFSPWADFRTYMDISLSRTLNDLRKSAHQLDPQTPVGIEGTQMPSAFGGYDLWRLANALDWVEPYDIGNSREILGSFMPGKPLLTTVGEQDASHAERRLWHLLLEGDRGCIVWWSEDCIDWTSPDYQLTSRAKALKPVLQEMTSPIAQIILRAHREYDPIFIRYSQPSIQVDWLLESTVDGSTWHRRFSSYEAEHNRMTRVRNSWLKLFQDLGYSPRFISAEDLSRGGLETNTCILVFPQALAMSDAEIEAVWRLQRGRTAFHTVFADGTPGAFDQHGKLRRTNSLESLFAPSLSSERSYAVHSEHSAPADARTRKDSQPGDIAQYETERLTAAAKSAWPDWANRNVDLPREITVTPNAHVLIRRFRVGGDRLIAFERNIEYKMSENLKQAGGNQNLEKPVDLEASLPSSLYVYDLNKQTFLAHTNRIQFKLDPWKPTILALLTNRVADGELLARLMRDR